MAPTTSARAGGAPQVPPSARAVPGREAAAGRLALAATGAVLGVGFATLARLRRGKPIHTDGAVLLGRLHRDGTARSGVAWLDRRSDDDVLVRLSRSAGLPAPLPDVHGLALRHGDVDLLLSTGGRGRVTRHVLRPTRTPGRGTYSSLVPYRGPDGPVMLAATPEPARRLPTDVAALAAALAREPLRLALAWASRAGEWERFGTLEVHGPAAGRTDPPVRFDPTRTPHGLDTYGWWAALRGPSYAAARRGHPADVGTTAVVPDHHRVPDLRSAP